MFKMYGSMKFDRDGKRTHALFKRKNDCLRDKGRARLSLDLDSPLERQARAAFELFRRKKLLMQADARAGVYRLRETKPVQSIIDAPGSLANLVDRRGHASH